MHDRLAAWLRTMYPAWRITRRTDRRGQEWWWARWPHPLTPRQRQMGVITWLARPTIADLLRALDEQAELLRRTGW